MSDNGHSELVAHVRLPDLDNVPPTDAPFFREQLLMPFFGEQMRRKAYPEYGLFDSNNPCDDR